MDPRNRADGGGSGRPTQSVNVRGGNGGGGAEGSNTDSPDAYGGSYSPYNPYGTTGSAGYNPYGAKLGYDWEDSPSSPGNSIAGGCGGEASDGAIANGGQAAALAGGDGRANRQYDDAAVALEGDAEDLAVPNGWAAGGDARAAVGAPTPLRQLHPPASSADEVMRSVGAAASGEQGNNQLSKPPPAMVQTAMANDKTKSAKELDGKQQEGEEGNAAAACHQQLRQEQEQEQEAEEREVVSWNELFQQVAARIRRLESSNNTTLAFGDFMTTGRPYSPPSSSSSSSSSSSATAGTTSPSRHQPHSHHEMGARRDDEESTDQGEETPGAPKVAPPPPSSLSSSSSLLSTAAGLEAAEDGEDETPRDDVGEEASPFPTLAALARDFVCVPPPHPPPPPPPPPPRPPPSPLPLLHQVRPAHAHHARVVCVYTSCTREKNDRTRVPFHPRMPACTLASTRC